MDVKTVWVGGSPFTKPGYKKLGERIWWYMHDYGSCSFEELQKQFGLKKKVLTKELDSLVKTGFIQKDPIVINYWKLAEKFDEPKHPKIQNVQ